MDWGLDTGRGPPGQLRCQSPGDLQGPSDRTHSPQRNGTKTWVFICRIKSKVIPFFQLFSRMIYQLNQIQLTLYFFLDSASGCVWVFMVEKQFWFETIKLQVSSYSESNKIQLISVYSTLPLSKSSVGICCFILCLCFLHVFCGHMLILVEPLYQIMADISDRLVMIPTYRHSV